VTAAHEHDDYGLYPADDRVETFEDFVYFDRYSPDQTSPHAYYIESRDRWDGVTR